VPPSPYPPYDYQCLYRDHCPHLDGLSTHWVLEEYQQAQEVYQEHLQIIDHFDGLLKTRDQRIRGLERENAELEGQTAKPCTAGNLSPIKSQTRSPRTLR
jgi:hypothetical protein